MKVLEITPLENKILKVLIIEKEYNEPFWFTDSVTYKPLRPLFKPSIAFCQFLEKLIKKLAPDYVTEESGMRSTTEFYEDNVLAKLVQRTDIPFFLADIDEYARGYLETSVGEKRHERDALLDTLSKYQRKQNRMSDLNMTEEYLRAYGQSLQLELEEEEHTIKFPVREDWIVMEILDAARKIVDKHELTCLHISSPEHVKGVKALLEVLDIQVEVVKVAKNVIYTGSQKPHSKALADIIQSMHIQVKPIIQKETSRTPYLLFFLDTDNRASPFDICMAYDAGFNAVLPYENVTPKDAKKIVQDAIFSRTKEGIMHTCFFIGGTRDEDSMEIYEVVKNTMFPPFETPVILDPGGAHPTAASMIAKVEDALLSHKLGTLHEKRCAVFGTGPVGKLVTVLLARLGSRTIIVEPYPKLSNGDEYVEDVVKTLVERYGVKVKGIFAKTPVEKLNVIKQSDVIFCATARGVRTINLEMLKELKLMKVLVDVNAIPPLGIEGIQVNDDMREIITGIFGIGALTIGKLKHELEKEILHQARKNGKGFYDYTFALKVARTLLKKRLTPSELSLTLSYKP